MGGATSRGKRIVETRRLYPYATLLFSELALILAYPFFIKLAYHDELFRLLAIIVFGSALYSVLGKGGATKVALILGIPAIIIRVTNIIHHQQYFRLPDEILAIIFLGYVTGLLVYTIISNPSVTADILAGAVSAYLLIGITFGLLYMTVAGLVPGSFRDTVDPAKTFTPADFTFFSFVTLTTVGYGDIVPWHAHARSLAIIESVIGIMYPALLISRLIGRQGPTRQD